METTDSITAVKQKIKQVKHDGGSVGFVPTMGFLHEGHLSLMRRARKETDFVVASIYVNPTQFGQNEDLDAYPRDIVNDARQSKSAGVDLLFAPSNKDMYPDGYSTFVNLKGSMVEGLCGKSRKGHFQGVATIVTKLFNIIRPDFAYFGQKDAQQIAVIRRMTRDLDMDVTIISCPIVRESDGLAMSSRNAYLSPTEREEASALSKSLFYARDIIQSGERSPVSVRQTIEKIIAEAISTEIEYIEIVEQDTLKPLEVLAGRFMIALAVKIGKTRLIDNLEMEL